MDHILPFINIVNDDSADDEEDILLNYFAKGFSYLEIIEFLRVHHDIIKSLSTLKRDLKRLGLCRRPLIGRRIDGVDLMQLLQHEFNGSLSNVGYRKIWAHLCQKGIIVRKEDVRVAVGQLDPDGVERRRRRKLKRRKYYSPGPNSVWHIDGYDKLKPFGFSFHGCMDGFSRRIIWLEVSVTNKKSEVIASYYLQAIKSLGGIPLKIFADDGTEHSIIQPMHIYLRSLESHNPEESFAIVSSIRNQRIESFWSKFRGDRIGWWRAFFQDLVDLEIYDPSDCLLLECARFCFMDLIRKELKELVEEWNQHIITRSKNTGPRGRPDTMFFLPHLYDSQSFLQNIDIEDINDFDSVNDSLPRDVSNEFEEFAAILMNQDNKEYPTNAKEALDLYIYFIQKIAQYL